MDRQRFWIIWVGDVLDQDSTSDIVAGEKKAGREEEQDKARQVIGEYTSHMHFLIRHGWFLGVSIWLTNLGCSTLNKPHTPPTNKIKVIIEDQGGDLIEVY